MNILISGGAGFIGSNLADALLRQGHSVVIVDNFITGRRINIAHLAGHPAVRFVERDIIEPLDDLSADFVYHLASPASPVGYGRHPLETMRTNSLGTERLLELARRCGAGFLLTSTSEAYGDPEIHPQPETYWGNVNPVGPRACYDESKRYAEAITVTYVREFGLDARIVRIFNTYGPRNDPSDGQIVPNFISQSILGKPITVFGDGSQTRSYCYVDDLVQGLLTVANAPDIAGEVFNLGNPLEYSALELGHLIKRLANSSAPIVHEPERPEEIARRKPDLTKTTQRLGWRPVVDIEQGLKRTIDAFRIELGVTSIP